MESQANISRIIIDSSQASLEETFLVCDDHSVITRRQFLNLIASRQTQLKNDLKFQEKVLVASHRGYKFWVDCVALWGLGNIAVPISPDIDEETLQDIIDITECSNILSDDTGINIKGLKSFPFAPRKNNEDFLTDIHIEPDMSEQLAAVLFTSGSTGKPKGVMLTHDALAGNCCSTLKILKPSHHDKLFINIPFHFTSAMCHFLAAAIGGFSLIGIEEKLYCADLMKKMSKFDLTCFGGAPLQIRWIGDYLKASSKTINLQLNWMMSSGDHLPVETIRCIREELPDTQIFTAYGLTELGGRVCILHSDFIDQYAGSVGKPIEKLTCSVRNEDDLNETEANVVGEIFVNGPFIFSGYLNDRAATAEVITEAGFRTGDLGFVDDHGNLTIQGRVDDVFKVHGQKVSGAVIATALMEMGIFEDVAITSTDHDMLGTIPVVNYVLKMNRHFNKKEVIQHLRQKLPGNSMPQLFIPCSHIPRTDSGKVIRTELKAN